MNEPENGQTPNTTETQSRPRPTNFGEPQSIREVKRQINTGVRSAGVGVESVGTMIKKIRRFLKSVTPPEKV